MSQGLSNHAIIVGYGLSGRVVADQLKSRGVAMVVVELNERTAERCAPIGIPFVLGDSRDPAVLERAGLSRAWLLAITLPDQAASLETVRAARASNPNLRILARCSFMSGGLQAARDGANEVIVAEQLVAQEFGRIVKQIKPPATDDRPDL